MFQVKEISAANRRAPNPENPAAEIGKVIASAILELENLRTAVSLLKGELTVGYPYGPSVLAGTANAYAALLLEVTRIADEMIGHTVRLGDDVLGVLSERERKDSHTISRDAVQDNWVPAFTAFADQQDETAESREDFTRRFGETLTAVRSRTSAG